VGYFTLEFRTFEPKSLAFPVAGNGHLGEVAASRQTFHRSTASQGAMEAPLLIDLRHTILYPQWKRLTASALFYIACRMAGRESIASGI
jgi:hypothetical protein